MDGNFGYKWKWKGERLLVHGRPMWCILCSTRPSIQKLKPLTKPQKHSSHNMCSISSELMKHANNFLLTQISTQKDSVASVSHMYKVAKYNTQNLKYQQRSCWRKQGGSIKWGALMSVCYWLLTHMHKRVGHDSPANNKLGNNQQHGFTRKDTWDLLVSQVGNWSAGLHCELWPSSSVL